MPHFRQLQLSGRHLGFGTLQLGLRLRDVEVARHPALTAVAGQLEGFAIGFDGLIQQLELGLQKSKREIIGRHFGLNGQSHRLKLVLRGETARLGPFHLPADAAPEIQFPTGLQRHREIIEVVTGTRRVAALRFVGAGTRPGIPGSRAQMRKQIRPGHRR